MIAPDDEDPQVRHIQVVAGNRAPNGAAHAFRIDAVDVPGLTEPITLAVPLGESRKSVDILLAAEPQTSRVSGDDLRALILRELETGEKSRKYLNTVARDELQASTHSVYKTGLSPLSKAERIKARKDGMDGGWYWSKSEDAP
jgi:hypothetical protein